MEHSAQDGLAWPQNTWESSDFLCDLTVIIEISSCRVFCAAFEKSSLDCYSEVLRTVSQKPKNKRKLIFLDFNVDNSAFFTLLGVKRGRCGGANEICL